MDLQIGDVYLVSYQVDGAETYLQLLLEQGIVSQLIDTRKDPLCRWDPSWNLEALTQRYGKAYVWQGLSLGNYNHGTGKAIQLGDPEVGVAKLLRKLLEGRSLALLCVCREAACHNWEIVRLLKKHLPGMVVHKMSAMEEGRL